MVTQYPDSIVVSWQNEPTQGASGDFTAGATGSNTFSCRAEINTKAGKIMGSDGQLIDFTQMVYMPLTTVEIAVGSDYVLTSLNGTVSGKVKRASNGQLNTRLWL
jgi:hypothetical protein